MTHWLYYFLKIYCRCALWFYFRRWQIEGKENVPAGPVVFVANHQNAFLDAVLVSCSSSRDMWFLARAEVFQKAWAKKILGWLKMMPVFRFRDGFGSIKNNDQIFNACVELLEKQESILIFAEGNHHDHFRLRPLQKGFARIAVDAFVKSNGKLNVKIVPVGIQYEQPDRSLSRVLVTFGKAFSVQEIIDTHDSYSQQVNDLVTFTANQLQPLILHIEEEQYEQKFNYLMHYRLRVKDLTEQLAIDQATVQSFTEQEGILTTPLTRIFWNPLYTYWFINTLVPTLLIRWILKTKMKDVQFTASLKFSLGMVLIPLFIILQSGLVYSFSNSILITVAYALSVPLSIKIHSRLI